MHTIWKFPLPPTGTFTLMLPRRARFLAVQMQHETPQMWFLLDPDAEKVERIFRLVGTGHEVLQSEMLSHLGTFQHMGGDLVFHLFEYDALVARQS